MRMHHEYRMKLISLQTKSLHEYKCYKYLEVK